MNRVAYGRNMAEKNLGYPKPVSLTLHKKTIKSKEKQYINWSLNRYPTHNEFKLLAKFFWKKNLYLYIVILVDYSLECF